MAQGKKSFILYCDQRDIFEQLTFEQAGKLIMHIFQYVNDEDPISDDPFTNLAFASIKNTLKRDLEKWEKQHQQRIEAGKKSAESRKRNATTVNERSISSTVSGSVSVNVNDSVNDNVKEIEIMDSPNLKDFYSQVYKSNIDIELVFDGVIKMRCSEYENLLKSYTLKDIQKKMTSLSTGIHNKDKKYLKYKDHYRTILNWLQKDCQKKSLNGFSKKLI